MSAQTIRVLPACVVERIAAGEVVERPASVVKELVENSLDAGASTVTVQLTAGGLATIEVTDDGCGMSHTDAQLALLHHATSKLRDADDLFRIRTLGFRGEALSSIAAISTLTLTTRQADATAGFMLQARGGNVCKTGAAGCPRGTSIAVGDLFYNTPARRKFMRSPATEQSHVVDTVIRIMLGHRRGAAVVCHGSRRLLDIPGEVDEPTRIAAALGARAGALHALAAEVDGVRVSGYMSAPEVDRGDAKGLWFFVNGRFVRDRILQRAVVDVCGDTLRPGRYPTVVLYVDIAPDRVDVNVHPQKLEVRFADGAAVYRAVSCAVAGVMTLRPWQHCVGAETSLHSNGDLPLASRIGRRSFKPAHVDGVTDNSSGSARDATLTPQVSQVSHMSLEATVSQLLRTETSAAPVALSQDVSVQLLGAVLDRYFVAQHPGGLILVDWPRVAAEQALAQMQCEAAEGRVRAQTVLLPEWIEACAPWAEWLDASWSSLSRYGCEIEPVAPKRYLVRAIPEAAAGVTPLPVAMACVEAAYAVRATCDAAATHQVLEAMSRAIATAARLPELDVAQVVLAEMGWRHVPGVICLSEAALADLFTAGA